jgi:hypothetical protein
MPSPRLTLTPALTAPTQSAVTRITAMSFRGLFSAVLSMVTAERRYFYNPD